MKLSLFFNIFIKILIVHNFRVILNFKVSKNLKNDFYLLNKHRVKKSWDI